MSKPAHHSVTRVVNDPTNKHFDVFQSDSLTLEIGDNGWFSLGMTNGTPVPMPLTVLDELVDLVTAVQAFKAGR